jgi:intracellular septation protein A
MKNLFHAARPILSDMFSTILFAALFSLTDNVYLSTGFAVALGVGQVVWEKARGKPVPGMQWASLGLVTVLGGAIRAS